MAVTFQAVLSSWPYTTVDSSFPNGLLLRTDFCDLRISSLRTKVVCYRFHGHIKPVRFNCWLVDSGTGRGLRVIQGSLLTNQVHELTVEFR